MISSIQQVLDQTSQALETFVSHIKTSKQPASQKQIEDISHFLSESKKTLTHLKNLKDHDIQTNSTLNAQLTREINRIQSLLNEIHMIKADRATQEQVGILQASFFWSTIEDFQNLIKHLKDDHKRGIRAEKVDAIEPESE